MVDRPLISVQEFSELSGLAEITVRRRLRKGLIPFTQQGGRKHRILIPIAALHALEPPAQERPQQPAEPPHARRPEPQSPGPKPRWMRGPKSH